MISLSPGTPRDTAMSTRKRTRSQLHDEDELSPEKGAASTPLASTKKRKLNLNGSSPAGGITGSLKRTFGGLLGWGKKGKENLREEAEEEDELAGGESLDLTSNKIEIRDKDIYDIESSEAEEDNVRKPRSGSERTKPTPISNKAKAATEKGSAKSNHSARANKIVEDIWEVPEDDGSAIRSSRKLARSAEKAKALLAPVVQEGDTSTIRSPGRPKKSQILKDDIKLSKKAARERMMAAGSEGEEGDGEAKTTPKKRKSRRSGEVGPPEPVNVVVSAKRVKPGRSTREHSPELMIPEAAASTGKKGQPRRASIEDAELPRQVPKGILTPSKNRPGRPRKSVTFGKGEVDLGFKDIPGKISKVSSHDVAAEANEGKQEDDVDEDQDDIACAICSGLNSTIKNPIIFCDGEDCEYAAHKNCEKLSVIPEEEWFCRDCQSTPEPEIEVAAEEEIESDDSEDVACVICSGLDSKAKNPIILCDGEDCDYSVHIKCCQLSTVPRGKWFCEECELESHGNTLFPQLNEDLSLAESPNNLPDIEGVEDHLRHMQRLLLDKLTGQKRIRLRGYDEEMKKVHQVVEQTILAGEGNSILVIGAKGSGKSTLVESVISDLSDQRENFHVVRLNGFIHTDDKLALKEIWRQLGREMELDDDTTGKTSNYADTLASLLALLSHPSEISEAQTNQTAKSVIFVLDEFDLFTTHSRQTLLYNLFDIAQAKKAPIVVLGLTARIDVVESLEKRVKSRFSHRYVHLSLPRSIPAFWDICKAGLTVDMDEVESEGFGTGAAGQDEFLSLWQNMIENLYSKDETFKRHIELQFYRNKSVPEFFTSCVLPIANLSGRKFPLTGKSFTSTSLFLSAPDSKLELLRGLSELELALLIAAARLDIILDTDTCNFAMAYDEYSSLTSRYKIQTSSTGVTALGASAKVWGRDVSLAAWERLAEYELLVPAGIGGGSRGGDFGVGGRMWKVDVGLEEITGSVETMSAVMIKWCREI
ncbi:hypothetical protein N431DRAFT_490007 [Stipitochalara longipes BDJ]|nr:hypothetical protein N431DRAFT_490007 [Stipitochalara longipes BDJ]